MKAQKTPDQRDKEALGAPEDKKEDIQGSCQIAERETRAVQGEDMTGRKIVRGRVAEIAVEKGEKKRGEKAKMQKGDQNQTEEDQKATVVVTIS